MMRRIIQIAILALFTLVIHDAQAQLIPALGRERAGTASATFLKIGVGARAAAMGDAFVSLANDASALYWNPAGITQLPGVSLHVSHTEYVADIAHEFAGVVLALGEANAIGVSVIALHTDEMALTTEVQPYGTGQRFSYSDLALGLSYARQLTDKFSAGITARVVREDLATVHLTGFLVDVGTIYETGWRGSRFAVSISNFGTDLTASGEITDFLGNPVPDVSYQSFSAPLMFRIGFSVDVLSGESQRATLAFQLDHPNDDAEHFNMGGEYRLNDRIVLRAGYKRREQVGGLTAGFGLDLPLPGRSLAVDYAFTDFGILGYINRFTVNFHF